MLNLIGKDIVLQKKTLLILLAGLCVYLALDVSSIWVGIVFSIVLYTNTFALDEKSSTHTLLNALPYTRKEVVSSKYIVAMLFTLLVAGAIFIGNLAFHGEIIPWKNIFLIIAIALTAASIILPFCYKFKSSYLSIGSIVAFGLYLLIVTFVVPNLNDRIGEWTLVVLSSESTQLYLIMAALVMVLYIFSGLLSIRIYRNKVL
ncbi:ABC-2 transporter permease [Pontibacillus salicampi]|uniref:ABC-2 transporter permease n=1 Tax=Pontibacillus salicampi TaxID=1449801 RepID=A0ABV6LSF8_9BACI